MVFRSENTNYMNQLFLYHTNKSESNTVLSLTSHHVLKAKRLFLVKFVVSNINVICKLSKLLFPAIKRITRHLNEDSTKMLTPRIKINEESIETYHWDKRNVRAINFNQ